MPVARFNAHGLIDGLVNVHVNEAFIVGTTCKPCNHIMQLVIGRQVFGLVNALGVSGFLECQYQFQFKLSHLFCVPAISQQ